MERFGSWDVWEWVLIVMVLWASGIERLGAGMRLTGLAACVGIDPRQQHAGGIAGTGNDLHSWEQIVPIINFIDVNGKFSVNNSGAEIPRIVRVLFGQQKSGCALLIQSYR